MKKRRNLALHKMQKSQRSRKLKSRNNRKVSIMTINNALTNQSNYSKFIAGRNYLNKIVLATLASTEPKSFNYIKYKGNK